MTPSAVPNPAVARDPVLQWVRTLMGAPAGFPTAAHSASAPNEPMARLLAMSAASIPSHSAMTASTASAPDPSRDAASFLMRSTASPRLTAVGLLVLRWSIFVATNAHTSPAVASVALAPSSSTASARAAAIAIAGAPRTFMSLMAVQHTSQSGTSMKTVSVGSFS